MATEFLIGTKNNQLQCFGEAEKEWKGPFYFIQGSDPQFGMIEEYLEKKEDYGWTKEIELSRKAVSAINRMRPKPKFFVVCGDFTQAFPGQKKREEQEVDLKKVYAELDSEIPLVCICGNHDVGNHPTPETVAKYRNSYGDDYFSFFCSGVFFIAINSQYYWDRAGVKELAEEHDRWLDEQLLRIKDSDCKHAVIFQHIPWFLEDPQEPDHEIFTIIKEIRLKMLEKFLTAGVRSIFCGHYHRNAGGFYGGLEQIVTSAIGAQLGEDDHGVRIVRVLEDGIRHEYISLDQLPTSIDF